ncbi:MAG: 2-keto-4-pentenoate hydratase [Alphaproteobacteria bacterium]|jgi:2-keto-4-pentenoate hydratase|nr:2-keto-4-pentenoate hydratase [Alphaproteobacteria bacterium]MBT4016615.1 2-keto-4-pentenoate hydratase [Alphaproteobacteria bacterium]MBT4964715.1 2-keto-4-pentenoate hydratase [Alphaproteobacteria bacterium]MBT5158572.1 2-keto-4-pentenoate hydratase [Alphaproteobacteria bacterium]MBT7746623.1 2-keto-4-pentenoate hydratase [Alphaproteobacteria bacterium]
MASDQNNIEKAADLLFEAHNTGKPCSPIRDLLAEGDVDAAYAVQAINTKRFLDAGRRLVGRKIGLTSRAVQTQLGVDQPDYGMLYADMDVAEGEEVDVSRVLQPKVEAEIAFIMGDDLDDERLTTADILSSIDYAVAAIEIVGSRVADWDIRIQDTVADNASSGLFVLGHEPKILGEFDPRLCGMVMECRGEPVSVGAGAACLGSPVSGTLWLARVMAGVGQPLRKGDIVLSGALGPMAPVVPGDVVEARIEGLGSVRANFAAA